MKTIEYHFTDKSTWKDGSWQHEPDKKQWLDEATKLPCLIVRNQMGALCGYVGVDSNHPYFEKEYDDVPVNVHGGLTFAGKCAGNEHHICHLVEDGENDHVMWFGFDCSHSGDWQPAANDHYNNIFAKWGNNPGYRDFDYVTNEVQQLAKQLKKLEKKPNTGKGDE